MYLNYLKLFSSFNECGKVSVVLLLSWLDLHVLVILFSSPVTFSLPTYMCILFSSLAHFLCHFYDHDLSCVDSP
jgi:hypothetical protein